MAKKEKDNERNYSEAVQKYYLEFLVSSEEAFSRCQSILNPSYFDAKYRSAVRFVLKYADDNKSLPSTKQIQAKTMVDLTQLGKDEVASNHVGWFLGEIEQFCRHKALEAAIESSVDQMSEGNYGLVEQRVRDAIMVGLEKDLGTSFFDNPRKTLEDLRSSSAIVSTGWSAIDKKLFGGFNRGELNIFAASSGMGKSLFLQNLGLNWAQMGLNVVYISLELSEALLHLRLSAMISALSTKMVYKNLDDVEMKIVMGKKQNRWGEFQIKYLPAGSTSNDIKVYLKEYEIQTGIKPDAVLVDYLDLVHPNNARVNPSDLFIKDKYVSEELRNLASEWNVLFATASQLNRSAIEEQEHEMYHIAGGLSKINTADNVMTIWTSEVLKNRGEYRIQFLKTRSSSGVGTKVTLAWDIDSLRITDMPDTEENGTSKKDISEIGEALKRKTAVSDNNSEKANGDTNITDVEKLIKKGKLLQGIKDLRSKTSS